MGWWNYNIFNFSILHLLGSFPNLTVLHLEGNDFGGRILGESKLLYIVMFIYFGLIEKYNLLLFNQQSCKI
jgi:hypothetical protein